MACARTVFNYGYDDELLNKPRRFGEGFKVPSRQTIQLPKAEQGPKTFEADERRPLRRGPLPTESTDFGCCFFHAEFSGGTDIPVCSRTNKNVCATRILSLDIALAWHHESMRRTWTYEQELLDEGVVAHDERWP